MIFLKLVWGFFTSHPALIALAGLGLALAVQTGRLDHSKADLNSLRKADAAAVQLAADRLKAANVVSASSAQSLASERVQIVTRTKTLRQEVPVYVPAAADAQCVIPVGFVRLLDAGSQGLPRPSGEPDPAPAGYGLSTVADNVLQNYGIAYDWKAEALSWRAWYVKQSAIFNGK